MKMCDVGVAGEVAGGPRERGDDGAENKGKI